tara:strand:- start:560 stop:1150 length:591 start_codon:yes stop_codon:yes gene_type:complete
MNPEKNIIEIVKDLTKNLDKNFPTDKNPKISKDVYENIIVLISQVMISIISDMDKLPVTTRNSNKIFQQKALSDSQLLGLVVFSGIFHIYVLQNLDEIDKSRVSDDNTRIISTTFVLENLAENKDNIKIISHGSKQISKMISHEDKNLKKILSTLRVIVDDYIKNKGKIGSKLKKTFPNYVKAFRFYYETITSMYE